MQSHNTEPYKLAFNILKSDRCHANKIKNELDGGYGYYLSPVA